MNYKSSIIVWLLVHPKGVSSTKYNSNQVSVGVQAFCPRSNFGLGGQESSPQSLTAATLKR